MLQIELNEFSLPLLRVASSSGSYPALARILAWQETRLTTADRYESGWLEPWVQWVSVHTGRPSSVHGIRNLGDVPNLGMPQIWEELARNGISSGIWGAMNAARRDAPACRFFVPDPWTFSEDAFPAELSALIDLPRYLARDYLNVSAWRVLTQVGRFIAAAGHQAGWWELGRSLRFLASGLARFGVRHFVLITWFEYLSGMAFLARWQRERPDYAVVFLNNLAHVQHHYWTEGAGTVTPPIAYALRLVDAWLQRVLETVGDAPVLVTNGLSQTNTNHEQPWVLYRQKDPRGFLGTVGLSPLRVDPLMTHDAHVSFATTAQRDQALGALQKAVVDGRQLFHAEADPADGTKLFYRLELTDVVPDDARAEVNGHPFRFRDRFAEIVTRTGKHIPVGVVFAHGIAVPPEMENHGLFDVVLSHFGVTAAVPLRQEARARP